METTEYKNLINSHCEKINILTISPICLKAKWTNKEQKRYPFVQAYNDVILDHFAGQVQTMVLGKTDSKREGNGA